MTTASVKPVATVTRYQLRCRSGKFAWYYAYRVELNGQRHEFGRMPLASVREWCKREGATVVETWKDAAK